MSGAGGGSTAILVRHPKGDLLIDAGFGADAAAHIAALPRFVRAPCEATKTVSEQLDAGGYDRGRLLGAVVTHSHCYHVSGLDEPQVPIWINAGERRYATEDPYGRARIPEITEAGAALCAHVAGACDGVEAEVLSGYSQEQVQISRRMPFDIIAESEDRGSCL